MPIVEDWEVERVADYVRSLPEFEVYTNIDGNYGHLGATLADAILQSNNNYERNVRARIARIRKLYGRETTLQDLKRLLQQVTAQEFLAWKGVRKPTTFRDLVNLLEREAVNTEDDLREWLRRNDSSTKLLGIRYIGPKTADYLKILVGLPVAAMDRHLLGFLQRVGIDKTNYLRGQEMVHRTADLMKIERAHLDHSIWRYMSAGKIAASDERPSCIDVDR